MIAVTLALAAPEFEALDQSIDKCDRTVVMPILAGEAQRRSAFATLAYNDQSAISAERVDIANRRRAIREISVRPAAKSAETDQQLALMNLALDDRQRALDDRRRLEGLREEAIDLKRRLFLVQCSTKDDIK